MTPTTSQESSVLSTSDTARAVRAAEDYLGNELPAYDQPAGGDEFDSWEASSLELDDESEVGTVSENKILVECTVTPDSGGGMFFVTVELDREFKPLKHDLDDAIQGACEDAAADAYTARAEAGFPDA